MNVRKVLECATPLALWGRVARQIALTMIFIAPFLSGYAQPPPTTTGNSLIQLMMSQPPADISSPVTATAAFDPPLAQPGEKVLYRVTFNATEASIRMPEEIPAPSRLKLQRDISGQIMQSAGGIARPLTTFNYEVRISATGQLTVPEFVAEVYGKSVLVPAAALEVLSELPGPHEGLRQLVVETAATNLYVGETLPVRVLLPANSANSVEGLSQVQLNGDGFLVDKNAVRQPIQSIERNGQRVGAYIYEANLTPIAAGTLKISAQGFTAGMQFGGPIVISGQVSIPGGPPKYVLLGSEPVSLRVQPLPDGELPGFAGGVGSYSADLPHVSTNVVRVGDPVELRVTIRGQQNLNRLAPPAPPRADGWQIFPAVRNGLVGEPGTPGHGTVFSYTLIPTTDEVRATPAIPFSCFDPRRGSYVDLTIQPVAVNVISNAAIATDDASVLLADGGAEPEKKPALSKFVPAPGRTAASLVPLQLRRGFLLMPLTPVLGFCALWFWDYRRRFLEQHPEIARRRRARRELRRMKRTLRQAAIAGDVSGFRAGAVKAMQVATAPHFPAEPKALVGGDVLEILEPKERAGRAGEVVRRFFAQADAAAFAPGAGNGEELLGWQSDLENVLLKLEARL